MRKVDWSKAFGALPWIGFNIALHPISRRIAMVMMKWIPDGGYDYYHFPKLRWVESNAGTQKHRSPHIRATPITR